MTKQEFLSTLREALSEELNEQQVAEQINFYRQYIETQTTDGRREMEVLDELGDPRMIARNIMDGAEAEQRNQGNYVYEQTETAYTSEDGWKLKLKTYGCLGFGLLILFLIITFVTRLIVFLLPSILVFAVLIWIFKQFNRR